MEYNQKSDDDKKVIFVVEGKHARIRFVAPTNPPTYEELVDFHRRMAEIYLNEQFAD